MLHALLGTGWLQEASARNITGMAQYLLTPGTLSKNVACITQYWLTPGTLSKECCTQSTLLVDSRNLKLEMLHTLLS
jgi:hypothetical protein